MLSITGMIRNLSKKIFIVSSVLLIIVGIIASITHIVNLQYANNSTLKACLIILTCLFILLSICFISGLSIFFKNKKKRMKELRLFRNKISHLTQATNVTVMQYDVKRKIFIRWKDTGDEEFRHFTTKDYFSRIHPDDMAIAIKLMEIMDGHKIGHYACEYRYMFPNAKEYSWQYNDIYEYEIDKDGTVKSYLGICQKHNQMHEMKAKIDLFRQKSSFVLTLNKIYIIHYNSSSHTITLLDQSGDNPDRIIPFNTFWSSVHPEDIGSANSFKQILDGHQVERAHTEFRYQFEPGTDKYEWLDINASAFEIDTQNEINSYVCLCRNISEWKRTMKEMSDLRDKAEMSNKLKTAFLANMSHEIRTPLNSILGFSNLLSENITNDDREIFQNIIKSNTEQLLNIIDDIINLSEIESGYINLKNKQFSVYSLFKEIAEIHRLHLHSGVDLICHCPADYIVNTDERRVREITSTYLKNADKFTKNGCIKLDYSKRDDGLYVSVTDTGIGIDKADQQRIFDRFEKVDSFIPGAGLGLSICREIIKKMNGKIGVESEKGKGSTFWFWIPCEMSEPLSLKEETFVLKGNLVREQTYIQNENAIDI